MLQYDGIYPMDCVYMDSSRDSVHLQVPLGKLVFCEFLRFEYLLNAMYMWIFLVSKKHVYLHCRYAPIMQSNSCRRNSTL